MSNSKEDTGVCVGIDLGTTYSCVAVWRDNRAEIIANDQGNRTTPSYVAFTESERLIGDAAKNQVATNPTNTIYDAKRLIGRKFTDPSVDADMKHFSFNIINDKDDKPLVKKVADMLKKASKKHASQSKMLDKAVNEADLTDKQVKMVRKVADKLPKDDFKKRYGKDADNVKFGTATNIVKKKLNIDGYEGARNLVDRLLKKERGDE